MKQTAALCSSVALIVGGLSMNALAQAQQAPPDLSQMMNAMSTAMAGSSNAAHVVDFRELKALLPAELPGMKRTSATGEKSGAMGMTISFAEATYDGTDGAQSMHIKLSDMSGINGLMGMASVAWASMEIDKETEDGYEKTGTVDGHKFHELYFKSTRHGEVQIYAANRFVLEVEGSGMEMDAILAAAKQIDLSKLVGLGAK